MIYEREDDIMWTRGELKARGMAAFKANYWKCVLVALILAVVAGGSGGAGGRAGGNSFSNAFSNIGQKNEETTIEEGFKDTQDLDDAMENIKDAFSKGEGVIVMVAVLIGVMIVVLIATAIAFALNAFLFNPLRLGCNKFFVRNLEEPTGLNHLSAGFDVNYKNVVKVMFFKDLYIFLWALIPIAGIFIAWVKKYEYLMIPYLMADDPDLDKEQAFAESKAMMDGQKWNAFVLNVSFIGWKILSIFTIGILALLYVNPYYESTFAALYDTLRYGADNGGYEDALSVLQNEVV